MERFVKLAAAVILSAAMLSGCGQATVTEDITKNTLTIDGRGRVTAYLTGEFDKAYYDLSELASMTREEADGFNAERGDASCVTVEKVEFAQEDESRVIVEYVFDGSESCREFLGEELFYGTVSEALEQGRLEGAELKNVDDGSVLSADMLAEQGKKHIIITNMSAVIYCPSKVSCVGGEAFLNQDGSVDTTRTEGRVYILLKK